MEDLIERILSHPLLLVALSLICLLLLYAVLKRLVKMLFFCSLLAATYFAYVYYLEEYYPLPEIEMDKLEEFTERFEELIPQDWNISFTDRNQSGPSE